MTDTTVWAPPDPDEFRNEWSPEQRMDYVLTFLSGPVAGFTDESAYDQNVYIGGPITREEWESLPAAIACGATGCPAGWAVMFAGARPVDLNYPGDFIVDRDGREHDIVDYAAELFGLADYEEAMFHSGLTWDEMIARAHATGTGRRMEAART